MQDIPKEKVTVYYGKISDLARDCKEAEKRYKRETYAGRILLLNGLREIFGMNIQNGSAGVEYLEALLIRGEKGKPSLKEHPEIYFNISHSGNYAVCAFSRVPVGIDIQIIRPLKIPSLLRRTMSLEEQEFIHTSPEPDRAFCILWTRKESYLKWTGEGISREMANLDMDIVQQKIFGIPESQEEISGENKGAYTGCVTAGYPLDLFLREVR